MDKKVIDQYLASLRADGISSPAGMHWHDFWNWICKNSKVDSPLPPMPLILAASGESNDVKHRRLGEQLQFALAFGFGGEAIDWLKRLPKANWNYCHPADWHKSGY
jgi:hypothetical protein